MTKKKNNFKLIKNINVGINTLALVITGGFWYMVWIKLNEASVLKHFFEKSSIASTYSFMVADLIWAIPLLFFSIIGLSKNKFWGWTVAQMVNILWLYSVTAVLVRDLFLEKLVPGTFIFVPFAVLAIWQIFALWNYRNSFR
jgi:hypothetical protein